MKPKSVNQLGLNPGDVVRKERLIGAPASEIRVGTLGVITYVSLDGSFLVLWPNDRYGTPYDLHHLRSGYIKLADGSEIIE